MSGVFSSPTAFLPALALILALAALVLYRPFIAGWLGELRIGMALAGLPKTGYTLMHGVVIPDGSDATVCIDHLVCGPAGYFIIDTENRAGRISGGAGDAQWVRTPTDGTPYGFANPLLKNRRHVEALRRVTGNAPIHSVVVFVRGRFPDGMPDGVLTPKELVRHILAADEQAPPFDTRPGLRALGMAMATDAPAPARRPHHGGIWRRPAGHVLMAAAACVLAFAPGSRAPARTPATVVRYVPVPLASAAPAASAHAARVRRTETRHNVRHAAPVIRRHHAVKEPMQVIAMSNDLASILEDGHIITLHPGQKSPKGWRLVRATPRYADMISPHGRRFHFTP